MARSGDRGDRSVSPEEAAPRTFLGVTWAEARVRCVEVGEEGDGLKVLAVEEHETEDPFAAERVGDRIFSDRMSRELRGLIAELPVQPDR